jgi:AraC-like DNA-binding protein
MSAGAPRDVWTLERTRLTRTLHRAGERIARTASALAIDVVCDGAVAIRSGLTRFELHAGCASLRPARTTVRMSFRTPCTILTAECDDAAIAAPRVVAETTGRAWALALCREVETRSPGWQFAAEGQILVGLAWLWRLGRLETARPEWLDSAVDLARRQMPLARIAEEIGRHPSHVARAFRRHEGVSPGEYSRRCRLELAARALVSGEPIASVALDAGFCDQSHFTNAFHRVFGMTPSAYRRGSGL